MGKKLLLIAITVLVAAGLLLTHSTVIAQAQKPKIAPPCNQCHKPDEKILRGTLASASGKAETLQVQIGQAVWIVKFDDNTKLIGWQPPIYKIPKEKEIAVTYEEKDGSIYAMSISVKQPAKVPEKKKMSLEELAKLIDLGPEKEGFTIVDSRPAPRYHEGHIPGSINIYDVNFDKNTDRLPKEKDRLLIFYCGGITCQLSPSSARKAEKLGYTNVKVFHDGMPAWKKAGNLVVSTSQYVKDNMDKDIPQVIIDLRPTGDAQKDHIKDAVSIPSKEISTAKDRFPADKKAPIVLYADDAKTAVDAFKVVRGWGYTNTSVLNGGIEAWKKAGNPVVSNELKTAIVYVPKPRPGEIPVEDFKKIAETLPADKFILDVRDEDEAMQGMLKGAKNIPTQDIKSRLSEIPKDKDIIAHCSTGVRAEMAYHILKEAGYKARFLNANIKIDKDGNYEISKE